MTSTIPESERPPARAAAKSGALTSPTPSLTRRAKATAAAARASPELAAAVHQHLFVAQPRVAADRRVRRYAVLAAVALGDGERDALLRGLVEDEADGGAVQTEETLERLRRIGEDAKKLGRDAKLLLHGIEQRLGGAGGGLGSTMWIRDMAGSLFVS